MPEDDDDLVVKLHREAVERRREQKEKERALVEAMFREALERYREQEERGGALIEKVHQQAWEHYRQHPPPPVEAPKGVHYTHLPQAKPGDVLSQEWDTYRREVGRWLAEGQEGRYVLIKGTEIVGIYDSWDEAREEGLRRYLLEPMLIKQILTWEPILRVRGYNLPWPTSPSRSPQPG